MIIGEKSNKESETVKEMRETGELNERRRKRTVKEVRHRKWEIKEKVWNINQHRKNNWKEKKMVPTKQIIISIHWNYLLWHKSLELVTASLLQLWQFPWQDHGKISDDNHFSILVLVYLNLLIFFQYFPHRLISQWPYYSNQG